MATIKPAEVSAILKEQLLGFDGKASLNEVGTVLKWVMVLLVYTDLQM